MAVQAMLLQLTLDWYFAETDEEAEKIHQRAEQLRAKASSGFVGFLDQTKQVTEAAADEFSWFLGGSVSRWERDELLSYVQILQDVTIQEKQGLRAGMFVISLFTGSGEERIVLKGVRSLIKNNKTLIKEAEKTGADSIVQNEINDLVRKFLSGNPNPGVGTKHLFNGIYELRGRNGGRAYYRINDGAFEILGKSSKNNQDEVINIINRMYGND